MDELNLKMQTVSVYSENNGYSVEQPVDCDITLPDYCTSIQRILKCASIPGIASVSLSGSSVKAEGTVTVRVIYIDENDTLQTYDAGVPFSKQIEIQEKENIVFTDCIVKNGYINSRAVTGRRIDVHGAVTLRFILGEKLENSVVTTELPVAVERKQKVVKLANSVADAGRFFHVTEVETLKSMPEISSVIRSTGYAVVNEVKVIKDKALIKGNLLVTTSYTSPEKSGVFLFESKIQISQIVDATGLADNEIIDTRVHLTQLSVIPKADATGAYTLLDISAKMMAEMHAYKETEICGVADAYSTERPVSLERKTVPMLEFYEKVSDTFSVKASTDLSSSECGEIIDLWYTDVNPSYRFENGRFELTGSVNICFITDSAEGGYNYYERSVDFTYSKAFETELSNVFCTPFVTVISTKAATGSDDIIAVELELSFDANIFDRNNTELVSNISFIEGETYKERDSAAVIYFASKNENVWDIARHYNTTVRAVMEENEISDDVIATDKMLLIPG